MGRFIVDFFCADARLVVEVDGDTHADPEQMEYDRLRTAWLEEQGWRVMRVSNDDVYGNIDEVLTAISRVAERGASVAAALPT